MFWLLNLSKYWICQFNFCSYIRLKWMFPLSYKENCSIFLFIWVPLWVFQPNLWPILINLRKEGLKLVPAAWRPLQGPRTPNKRRRHDIHKIGTPVSIMIKTKAGEVIHNFLYAWTIRASIRTLNQWLELLSLLKCDEILKWKLFLWYCLLCCIRWW